MKFFLLFSLIIFSSYGATTAQFKDNCHHRPVLLTGPNGIYLSVDFSELDETTPLNVHITFRPAGILEDLSFENKETQKYIIKPQKFREQNYSLRIKIPKTKWLYQQEQKHQSTRIWDARIFWWQDSTPKKTGSALASFMRVLPKEKEFFQITGSSLCVWEANANISSKYYENRVDEYMKISRTYDDNFHSDWQRGFALGPNNIVNMQTPLLPFSGIDGQYGWFFRDWQNQFDKEALISIEKTWKLNREDFGVFAKRFTFSRLPTTKWQWVQEGKQCGEWKAVSKGALDVGIETEDFYTLPSSYYGTPDKVNTMIDLLHPPLDTCQGNLLKGPMHAQEILPNGFNGIMYYYNEGSLQ